MQTTFTTTPPGVSISDFLVGFEFPGPHWMYTVSPDGRLIRLKCIHPNHRRQRRMYRARVRR